MDQGQQIPIWFADSSHSAYCFIFAFEFFLNNTNLTFCTKPTSRGFKKFQQKIKLPAVGNELTTVTITGIELRLVSLVAQPPASRMLLSLVNEKMKWAFFQSCPGPFGSQLSHIIHFIKYSYIIIHFLSVVKLRFTSANVAAKYSVERKSFSCFVPESYNNFILSKPMFKRKFLS